MAFGSFTSLPIVSLAALLSPTSTAEEREALRLQLTDILLHVGFFYVKDFESLLPRELLDRLFDLTKQFFALPLEHRRQIDKINSRNFRGYSEFKEEITAAANDARDQIDIGPETEYVAPFPPEQGAPLYLQLYGPNQLPSDDLLPGFRKTVLEYHAHATHVSDLIVNAIFDTLTLPNTAANEGLRDLFRSNDAGEVPYSRMKLVRYPPTGIDVDGLGSAPLHGLGVGAHRDGGILTLLAQDDTGGLQVQNWDGQWVPVKPLPYHFVVNVGQQIELLSRGLYPATTHRVLSNTSSLTRHSIPFFYNPILSSKLSPIPEADLRAELRVHTKQSVTSEVPDGDLWRDVYGQAAWGGIARSHKAVVEKHWRPYFEDPYVSAA